MFDNGKEKDSTNKSADPIVFSNPPSSFAQQLIKSHQTEDYSGTLALLKGKFRSGRMFPMHQFAACILSVCLSVCLTVSVCQSL